MFASFPGSFATTSDKERNKIALFDVDGTLITSKSGSWTALSAEDTAFIGGEGHVFDTLDYYHREGWVVTLVSNQSMWSKDTKVQQKIEYVLRAAENWNGWRPWCLIATGGRKDNKYRKPARGLYDVLLSQLGKCPTDITACFMVGDAVGESDPHPPYRWSSSDKEFAEAIGAEFMRPIDVFGAPPAPAVPPASVPSLVLMMGNPGSGKSTTARMYERAGYIHIEQDRLKNKAESLRLARDSLKYGLVVVDATHGSDKNRDPYIQLAKERGIEVHIVWHICGGRPFNRLREKPVPDVAYGIYTKHFVEPVAADNVTVSIVW